MASLVAILDLKGKSLIQRSYRDDVSPSHIERFLPYILDLEEKGSKSRHASPARVNADGNVIRSEILGAVKMKCYLSGMPELRLGLNDKVMFESTGRTSRGKSIEMEDVKFHQCVRLSRFENDRTISFIPPDGEFELMSYRLSTPVKPLIWVEAAIESHKGSRIEYMGQGQGPPSLNGGALQTMWKYTYRFLTTLIARSSGRRPGHRDMEKRAPITVRFEIPYFTVSGIQVRYLKIVEKSGYQALPWVRYITQHGDDYSLRTALEKGSAPMTAHVEEISDHEGHDPMSTMNTGMRTSTLPRQLRLTRSSRGPRHHPRDDEAAAQFVANPEVFKSPNSECYIVFGEAKTEDMAAAHAAQVEAAAAAERMAAEREEGSDEAPTLEPVADDEPAAEEKPNPPEDDDETVDETGVDSKDIELIMQQVGCSRAKAVKALKDSGGDLINAIMAANE
ncbi:Adaptor complexes medium subunit family [Ceratobasidium sp. AG-Ba]|nr:Adaptor complexes medium subunit family [Ceratobasidium sp. AG-Ba]